MNAQNVKPGLKVFARANDADEQPQQVATVDHLDGENYIKLKRSDSPDGEHHWIPLDLVSKIDEHGVVVSCSVDEFENEKLDELPDEAPIPRRAVI